MDGAGCWSTVVCTPAERAALGLTAQSEWLLRCRLAAGHPGNHATDASIHPRYDRRLWLEWNDFDDRAQSLIERNPCRFTNEFGMGCLFFDGHGGPHYVSTTNGHAKPRPAPPSAPVPASPIHPAGPASGERHVMPRGERPPIGAPGRPAPGPRQPVNGVSAYGQQTAAIDYPLARGAETLDATLAGRHVMPDPSASVGPDLHAQAAVSRRHRMPEGGAPPPADNPRVPSVVRSAGPSPDLSDAGVGDALNEVAKALSKLADAIRTRG